MLLHKYREIKILVDSLEKDIEKIHEKGTQAAGIRARKKLSELKNLSLDLRKVILNKRKIEKEEAEKHRNH